MFAIVVNWIEPESGTAVYGPYDTKAEAHAAWDNAVHMDFMNGYEVPEDVEYEVMPMTNPK